MPKTRARQKVPRLTAPAQAVMKAFRAAKFAAPAFMSSCGVFPEVSESASDRLHAIVHKLATGPFKQGRAMRALNQRLQRLAAAPRRSRLRSELLEGIREDLTAVLSAEATAAYLFGLSVGLTVRSLPERLDE
jgi:DNA-binding transcriptional regulator YbjK